MSGANNEAVKKLGKLLRESTRHFVPMGDSKCAKCGEPLDRLSQVKCKPIYIDEGKPSAQ